MRVTSWQRMVESLVFLVSSEVRDESFEGISKTKSITHHKYTCFQNLVCSSITRTFSSQSVYSILSARFLPTSIANLTMALQNDIEKMFPFFPFSSPLTKALSHIVCLFFLDVCFGICKMVIRITCDIYVFFWSSQCRWSNLMNVGGWKYYVPCTIVHLHHFLNAYFPYVYLYIYTIYFLNIYSMYTTHVCISKTDYSFPNHIIFQDAATWCCLCLANEVWTSHLTSMRCGILKAGLGKKTPRLLVKQHS